MALSEIEFELPAQQFQLMDYPNLKQGQTLVLQLDCGVLLPEPSAEGWYAVQPEPVAAQFVQIAPATYAFAGRIEEAELAKGEGMETAVLMVGCGDIPLRVTCAPRDDGRLPYGTWETRYLIGCGRIVGLVEEDFSTGIGQNIGVTIWKFRRIVLKPGDPLFGRWYETEELPPTPYSHDRILITARVHRDAL